MSIFFSPKNNPRVIIIQKLYGNFFNGEVKLSLNIIIKEYLDASNFFLEFSQTKYLNALIDKLGKNLRSKNERI